MEEATRTWVGSTRTRTRIIEATARAVLAHGLRPMTVQSILDEAEVSRRTFYQHFRSKEEAALALYRSVSRELIREVHAAMKKGEDLTTRLHDGLEAYLRFHRQVGDLVTLLRAEAADPDSPLAPQHQDTLNGLVRLVDNEVQQHTGFELEPQIYRTLWLGLEGLCAYRRDHGELTAPDFGRVGEVAEALFAAILASAFDLPQAES
jgi:AcrR family transcriptional regulator